MKVTIRIKFPNGDMFDVNGLAIARDRAKHYAELDVQRGDETDFNTAMQREIEYALSDDFELIDWMRNNMNWVDVAPFAEIVLPVTVPDYNSWFTNVETEVRKEETELDKLSKQVAALREQVERYVQGDRDSTAG